MAVRSNRGSTSRRILMPRTVNPTYRKVVESITKEFRELKDQPVNDEELRRAKDHLKGSMMLSLESTGSRMSNLARQQLYFGKFFTLDEMIARIEDVTAEEIAEIEAARREP